MNPLLESIRLRFSTFIAENIPEGRKEYYYIKINAIPDNIIDTKLPFMIKPKLRDLNKVMSKIVDEMEAEGINIKPLEQSIVNLADELKTLDKKFMKKATLGLIK